MSDGPEISIRVAMSDGFVCLLLGTDDEDVLVPMTPALADELADKIRDFAKLTREARPERVT